jgi:hypothetical protein
MANNISLVDTEWGRVIVTVRDKVLPNAQCILAPNQCFVLAYLAMSGQKDPFAAVHNHGEGNLHVINATVRTPDGLYLHTGPFATLPEAITEAARTFAAERERLSDVERAQRGLPPKAAPLPGTKKHGDLTEAQVEALRRKDTLDTADYGAVHWEQQLVEILGRK